MPTLTTYLFGGALEQLDELDAGKGKNGHTRQPEAV